MKIGIFYDYFGAIGGGEKTVLTLADILGAEIITTDTEALSALNPKVPVHSLFPTIKIPSLKQISASLYFSQADYTDRYDLSIFAGNWSIHAARRHKPNLWYCFTPTRAFHDLYDTFRSRQDVVTRMLFTYWVSLHRPLNQQAVTEIDTIVSISDTVADRVNRYYGRGSSVIHPPVNCSLYRSTQYDNFWLSVNRIYPEKRIELQIEAFRKMPDENLVIVGGYAKGDHASRYAKKILTSLPSNVEYRGEVSEAELLDLYASCKGHITTAMDEDFGLTPLEAMASGKPVVAVNEGEYRNTVVNGTGVLIPADISSIIKGVQFISDKPEAYRSACLKHAALYDISHFSRRFDELLRGYR